MHILDLTDPYSAVIGRFVSQQFPRKLCGSNPNLIDLLTEEILGTKQHRYGPKPSPESIVAMRDIIRHYIAANRPIPFLVPWGSEKPNGTGIDIAELAGLKVMYSLYDRVSNHYAPGIRFNIRIEDASAPHLFDDREKARRDAKLYTDGFVNLIKALELDSFIRAVPESTLITEETYNQMADQILPDMHRALQLLQDNKDYEAGLILNGIGWKGAISPDMLAYYLTQYSKLYPTRTVDQHIYTLAKYFAGSVARYRLKMRGDEQEWEGKYLDFSFVPPIPGTENYFARRVYYRTLPLNYTSNHIAPWRGKGYLTISNNNEVIPKIASFFEDREYTKHCLRLKHNDIEVKVEADYILV